MERLFQSGEGRPREEVVFIWCTTKLFLLNIYVGKAVLPETVSKSDSALCFSANCYLIFT